MLRVMSLLARTLITVETQQESQNDKKLPHRVRRWCDGTSAVSPSVPGECEWGHQPGCEGTRCGYPAGDLYVDHAGPDSTYMGESLIIQCCIVLFMLPDRNMMNWADSLSVSSLTIVAFGF